jgi:D-sedoheptulose 7-phosphate isomerase
MNNLDMMFSISDSLVEYSEKYFNYLYKISKKIDGESITRFVNQLNATRDRKAKIYFIGNGGSASTASHFANDLSIGTRNFYNPYSAVSLCDNVAVITAIGNDYSYENIFYLQLKALRQSQDMVVAISASGNSPNVVKAINYANELGSITFSLTGFDGGELKRISQGCIHVEAEKGEYGPVEDAHMIIDHLLNTYLFRACLREKNRVN